MQPTKVMQAIESLEHPLAQAILDRSRPLTNELVQLVIDQSQFGWQPRHPRLEWTTDHAARGTDLDLLSVLHSLYRTGTTLTIDSYQPRTPWQLRTTERHVGSVRRGPIDALISHQSHLSFSIRLEDTTVERVGGNGRAGSPLRTFMVVDYDGTWYEGWQGLNWSLREQEHTFFTRYGIAADSPTPFLESLHRNRRQSIFGAPYVLLKLLAQRIDDEYTARKEELQLLQQNGYGIRKQADTPVSARGRSKHESAPTYAVALHGLDVFGEYQPYAASEEGYQALATHVAELHELYLPHVQFVARAAEVAYYRFGRKQQYVAPWATSGAWEYDGASGRFALGNQLHLHTETDVAQVRVAA